MLVPCVLSLKIRKGGGVPRPCHRLLSGTSGYPAISVYLLPIARWTTGVTLDLVMDVCLWLSWILPPSSLGA